MSVHPAPESFAKKLGRTESWRCFRSLRPASMLTKSGHNEITTAQAETVNGAVAQGWYRTSAWASRRSRQDLHPEIALIHRDLHAVWAAQIEAWKRLRSAERAPADQ